MAYGKRDKSQTFMGHVEALVARGATKVVWVYDVNAPPEERWRASALLGEHAYLVLAYGQTGIDALRALLVQAKELPQ